MNIQLAIVRACLGDGCRVRLLETEAQIDVRIDRRASDRTRLRFGYLAANLILQGVVEASACPDGGIVPDGGANACGQEAARDAVAQWQNQFD
ncbi:MAG: hypothetical protein HGA66_14880, partial [Holophaga sp.]|nr:hypothetical protein [Holophaga sp.]